MCAAISENGVATHIPCLGPLQYTEAPHLLVGPQLPNYVIVWDNGNFCHYPLIGAWWSWRMYEQQAQDQRSLLHAMDAACEDIIGDQCSGWL